MLLTVHYIYDILNNLADRLIIDYFNDFTVLMEKLTHSIKLCAYITKEREYDRKY